MKIKKTMCFAAAFVAMASVSNAATLANWDFTGSSGSISDVSGNELPLISSTLSGAATNITSTDLIKSAGLDRTSGGGGTLTDELNLSSFGTTVIDTSSTLFFTLSADPGFSIDISSIAMSGFRNGGGAPATWQFLVSVDGGGLVTYDATQAAGLTSPNFGTFTFTEAITGADTVAIHYAPFGGGGNIHVNDIQVNGAVNVIPEPSAMLLGGLGFLGLLRRRRA